MSYTANKKTIVGSDQAEREVFCDMVVGQGQQQIYCSTGKFFISTILTATKKNTETCTFSKQVFKKTFEENICRNPICNQSFPLLKKTGIKKGERKTYL